MPQKANYDFRYLKFIELFNQEKFFEAHEVLEDLWRQTSDESKDFYHGLIQIAAAMVHVQRKNRTGAKRLLSTAAKYLSTYLPSYNHINLSKVLESCEQPLMEGKPFPRIVFSERLN